MTSTSTAQLTCHCGKIREPGALLKLSNFPIEEEICLCNICRRVTGTLGLSFIRLKSSPTEKTLANLSSYSTSENITRFFCTTCGCHCFVHVKEPEHWSACSGIIERDPNSVENCEAWTKDVVKVIQHGYVNDTLDGGLAALFHNIGGRSVTCYGEGEEVKPMKTEEVLHLQSNSLSAPKSKEDDKLVASCQCGRIKLDILRANWKEGEPREWHVPPDHTKYGACFCTCRSCRLGVGYSLQPWAYVPPERILNAENNKPVAFTASGTDVSGLEHYQSSEKVRRSFCKTCGATFFFQTSERPGVIDVSVGILRAESGSMAREWLDWDLSRMSHAPEATDQELVQTYLSLKS